MPPRGNRSPNVNAGGCNHNGLAGFRQSLPWLLRQGRYREQLAGFNLAALASWAMVRSVRWPVEGGEGCSGGMQQG
jgi:hypothetical protein